MIQVAALVLHRLRRRGRSALLIVCALAAAIAVLGAISGVAVITEDRAAQDALGRLPARDRSVFVNRYDTDGDDRASADATARAALARMANLTGDAVASSIVREAFEPLTLIAIDDLARWTVPIDGRMPAPCDGGEVCEAVGFGPASGFTPAEPRVGGTRLVIVGHVEIDPAFPLDPPFNVSEVFGVDGVGGTVTGDSLGLVPRTDFWVAPLDPRRVRGWSLDRLLVAAERTARDLEVTDSAFVLAVPADTIRDVRARAGAAGGRLVLVGSMSAAMLLAFAIFAAAIGRHDVHHEYRRLSRQGARRRELTAFIALEAGIPAFAGAALGAAAAFGAVAVIATWQEAPVAEALGIALGSSGTLSVVLGVSLLAMLAVGLGIHPAVGRAVSLRLFGIGFLPVAAVLAWDVATRGPLGRDTLASRAVEPVLVLMPAVLGLAAIVLGLLVLPLAFRWLARRLRRGPLSMRLSVTSLAGEPELPAAALVLLTFSLGAIVFAAGYGSTLRRGAADQAAFEAGMDLRVTEYGYDDRAIGGSVLPLDRYEALGPGVEAYPLARLDLSTGTGGPTDARRVVGVGLPPEALPRLRGWRDDFSTDPPAVLAERIRSDGSWRLAGHDLPPGVSQLRIRLDAEGDQVRLTAAVLDRVGRFYRITMGDLGNGSRTFSEFLPDDAIGGRLVALIFTNGGAAAAIGPEAGRLQRSSVVVHGLAGLRDETPIEVSVSGATGEQVIRAPQPTDGVDLPVLVTPGLAALADEQGRIPLQLPASSRLSVRVAGVISRFPTVKDADVVVFALDPMLVAINAIRPGAGSPSEVLIRTGGPEQSAEVSDVLTGGPFRLATVVSRDVLEADRVADPFAEGVVWALAIGAIGGLGLAVVGMILAAAVHLRDERGELAELEAQGVLPESLAVMSVARTGWLMVGGIGLGIVVGAALTQMAVSVLAIAADAATPVPPLLVVQAWPAAVAVVVAVVGLVGTGVGILVAGQFGRTEEAAHG